MQRFFLIKEHPGWYSLNSTQFFLEDLLQVFFISFSTKSPCMTFLKVLYLNLSAKESYWLGHNSDFVIHHYFVTIVLVCLNRSFLKSLQTLTSRQLCKPSSLSRVCITVSNSPNPSCVYIRLCKHGKRFLLLKYIHCNSQRDSTSFHLSRHGLWLEDKA